MPKKKTLSLNLTPEEQQLIEQLREHPELRERFCVIMEITANTSGPLKKADEVEGLLIEEMRRLGNTTLGSWAARAEKRLGEQLQQKEASAHVGKKKR